MYPVTVRRQIISRLRSGEPVAVVAAETGIARATLFRWKRQALIDAGVIEGKLVRSALSCQRYRGAPLGSQGVLAELQRDVPLAHLHRTRERRLGGGVVVRLE
jgi:transposase-like protein